MCKEACWDHVCLRSVSETNVARTAEEITSKDDFMQTCTHAAWWSAYCVVWEQWTIVQLRDWKLFKLYEVYITILFVRDIEHTITATGLSLILSLYMGLSLILSLYTGLSLILSVYTCETCSHTVINRTLHAML